MANDFDTLWGTSGAASTPDATGTTVLDPNDFDKTWLTTKSGEKAKVFPIVSPKPGALANLDHDDTWGPLKNISTGAIKGIGDSIGAIGNTANLADYLIARGQSAITGKPLEEVQADLAKRKTDYEKNSTKIGKLHSLIASDNVLPNGQDVSGPILAKTGEYVPTTEGQRLAQAGIQTVFGSLGPGTRGATAPVAGLPGNIVRQAPALAAIGGLGQGVTDATGDPLLGLAASAAVPAATRAAGGALNRVVGTVDPHTAALADAARNVFNIPVGAGEISSNPMVRFANSVVNKFPGSGGVGHHEAMQNAFERAMSNTFGEDAARLTPPVMARARDRIGDVFEDSALNTPHISLDRSHATRLANVVHDARMTMTPEEWTPLAHQVRNIAGLVDPHTGGITGEVYQNLTKRNSSLDRAMHSQNSNIKNSARDIRDVLDDAFESSARPEVAADLRNARREWKNLRTVEPLVAKDRISPALLQGRVIANNKGTHGAAYGGGGDLKTLADIGQRFLKEPPSSGTSERGLVMHLMGGAASGVAGMAYGLSPKEAALAILAPALGAGVGRGIGASLRSNLLTDRLINNSLGNPTQTAFGNYLYSAGLPALSPGNQLRP